MYTHPISDKRLVCSTAVREHLACEQVVLHEFVSPWDVLSSVSPDGSFREFDANVGVVGSVAATGNAVMSDYASLLPNFDRRTDQVLIFLHHYRLLTSSQHLLLNFVVPLPVIDLIAFTKKLETHPKDTVVRKMAH